MHYAQLASVGRTIDRTIVWFGLKATIISMYIQCQYNDRFSLLLRQYYRLSYRSTKISIVISCLGDKNWSYIYFCILILYQKVSNERFPILKQYYNFYSSDSTTDSSRAMQNVFNVLNVSKAPLVTPPRGTVVVSQLSISSYRFTHRPIRLVLPTQRANSQFGQPAGTFFRSA